MNLSNKGFTLIEVIVSIAIITILASVVFGIYTLIINQIATYRDKTTVSYLAGQYMEIARNLPYSEVGTMQGNPNGDLPDLPNFLTVNFGGNDYQVYYAVSYVDDPADGTILLGTDSAPTDYKQIKLYIKNTRTNIVSNFLTNISPKSLEGLSTGGALNILVMNSVGQPVPGATIHITNTQTSPTYNLTRISDANGAWIEVGLPESIDSYHIEVSKNGYSSDQTYQATIQNPNPTKSDSTVLAGQVTQISFSIDLLSDLNLSILDQTCQGMAGVEVGVKGAKLIGLPDIYKFNDIYHSNNSGHISFPDIEWDIYTPTVLSQNYMIYGSYPVQEISILPGTNQNFTFMVGPATDNALLVIVKDAANGNPVEGANVELAISDIQSNFTISALSGSNGSITPSGDVFVNRSDSQTFNINANSGYLIQNVWVDGLSIGSVSTYTFNDVVDNHAIYVSFTHN